jgi:hypothetical protein
VGNGAQTGTRDLVAERVVMVRLVALGAAALALLFIAAAIVGHGRERAVYNQLAEHNQQSSDLIEHRSIGVAP